MWTVHFGAMRQIWQIFDQLVIFSFFLNLHLLLAICLLKHISFQKKQVSDYARIDYVDISGVLIVLFNNVLYFFRIEDKSADVSIAIV